GRRNPGVLERAIADGTFHRANVGILPRRALDRAHTNVTKAAVVNVNVPGRVLGLDLDPVRSAIRENNEPGKGRWNREIRVPRGNKNGLESIDRFTNRGKPLATQLSFRSRIWRSWRVKTNSFHDET